MDSKFDKISVIGIGKLGLCFALLLEKAGFHVTGMDVDSSYVQRINDKTLVSMEPGVEQLLKNAKNFKATTNIQEALQNNLVFTVVPTPSLTNGSYDHSHIDQVVEAIQSQGLQKSEKHFVISCTTMPGYCDAVSKKIKKFNWTVSYNPEFVAQGSVLHDQENPDLVLVGEGNQMAGDILESVYRRLCANHAPIHRMKPISAEIAKIALNCFLTTKISFANTVGDVSVKAGAEPRKILDAIGSDSRVGSAYLKYGFGFGGPCLPRDNRALGVFAQTLGLEAPLCKATDLSNALHLENQVNDFCEKHPPGTSLALGPISYKTGAASVEESQQLAFAVRLAQKGYQVTVRDHEQVLNDVKKTYGDLFFKYEDSDLA